VTRRGVEVAVSQRKIITGVGTDGRQYTIIDRLAAVPGQAGTPDVRYRRELRLPTGQLVTPVDDDGRTFLIIRTGVLIQVLPEISR
jgi:hypothetical protein